MQRSKFRKQNQKMGNLSHAPAATTRSVAQYMGLLLLMVIVMAMMVTDVNAACPGIEEYDSCLSSAQDINSVPPTDCCDYLAQVAAQDGGPQCLCDLAIAGEELGLDVQAARALPGKCNVQNPTGFVCSKV